MSHGENKKRRTATGSVSVEAEQINPIQAAMEILGSFYVAVHQLIQDNSKEIDDLETFCKGLFNEYAVMPPAMLDQLKDSTNQEALSEAVVTLSAWCKNVKDEAAGATAGVLTRKRGAEIAGNTKQITLFDTLLILHQKTQEFICQASPKIGELLNFVAETDAALKSLYPIDPRTGAVSDDVPGFVLGALTLSGIVVPTEEGSDTSESITGESDAADVKAAVSGTGEIAAVFAPVLFEFPERPLQRAYFYNGDAITVTVGDTVQPVWAYELAPDCYELIVGEPDEALYTCDESCGVFFNIDEALCNRMLTAERDFCRAEWYQVDISVIREGGAEAASARQSARECTVCYMGEATLLLAGAISDTESVASYPA